MLMFADQLCKSKQLRSSSGIVATHDADQLRQWAQCYGLVVQAESKASVQYSHVAKARPDDLWFGPTLPYCALAPARALVSAQRMRFSDQFFLLPRRLAFDVFTMIVEMDRQGLISCYLPGREKGWANATVGPGSDAPLDAPRDAPLVTPPPPPEVPLVMSLESKNGGPFRLEAHIDEALRKAAAAKKVPLDVVHLPRVLSRDSAEGDYASKCQRFLWAVPFDLCVRLVSANRFCVSRYKSNDKGTALPKKPNFKGQKASDHALTTYPGIESCASHVLLGL